MEEIKLQLIILAEQIQNLSDKIDGSSNSLVAWSPSLVGILTAIVAFVVGRMSVTAAASQIEGAKEIAVQQISSERDIEASRFRASSRKEWIENLRLKIAAFLAMADRLHTELGVDGEYKQEHHQTLREYGNYIELMLNPNEDLHSKMVENLKSVWGLSP